MTPRRDGARPGIDWSDLRRRVDAAALALTGESVIPPERVSVLLEERARALARPVLENGRSEIPHLISFFLSGGQYGVEPRRVMEVCRAGPVAPIPGAEAWVAGVTGWRGELVLVMDLRPLVGAGSAPVEHPALMVLGDGRPRAALLADAPGELMSVPPGALQPAPDGIGGREFIRGMTPGAVLVLDVDRLLTMVEPEPA